MSKNQGQVFDIDEWSMDKVCMTNKHTPRIVFIGKTDTGKTTLVKDMLYHHQDVPFITVVSTTERFNKNYENIVPDMFIHDYSKEVINKFIKRQEFITEKCETDPQYQDSDPRAMIIFDDCLHKIKDWAHDEDIQSLFFVGRQINACLVLTMQHPMGITPDLRTNVDYVFLGYESIHTNKKKLYDHYAGVFPSFQMFCAVLDECTQDYGWLVIDHKNRSRYLKDKVFWYRAPRYPQPFRMCDDRYWKAEVKHIELPKDDSSDQNSRYKHYSPPKRPIRVRRMQNKNKEKEIPPYNPTFPKRF